MTGADRAVFGGLPAGAKLFTVTPGNVSPTLK